METQLQKLKNSGYQAVNFVDTKTYGNITVNKTLIEMLQDELLQKDGYTISLTDQQQVGNEIQKEITIVYSDVKANYEDMIFQVIITGNKIETNKAEIEIAEEDTDYDEVPEDFWLADEETGIAFVNSKYLEEVGYEENGYYSSDPFSGLDEYTGTNEYTYTEIERYREMGYIPTAGFNCEYTKLKIPSEAAIINEDGTLNKIPITEVNLYKILNITKIDIPDTITKLPNLMYSRATIEKIKVGNGIKRLDDYAFAGFMKLTHVSLPYELENNSIMYKTFYRCPELVEVHNIPKGVTELYYTFAICGELKQIPMLPNTIQRMESTFLNCKNLTIAPVIPISVIDMESTFNGCENLEKPPQIPENVINMKDTFRYCKKLIEAPVIPSKVTDMTNTFSGCRNLTGNVEINANPTNYEYCFFTTEKNIKITGTCPIKDKLAATSNENNVTY